MSTQPARTALQDDPAQQAADAHGYREVLHDIIGIGADFARLLHVQATAQAQAAQPAAAALRQNTDAPPAPTPPDALINLSAAFDRIARAVRRSILLARSLAQPVPPAQDPAHHRAAARKRIIREVEDTIQRTPGIAGRPGAETLHAELQDRLDAPDLDDDITTRPVADIITELCRDLGLAALPGARPWQRRTPDDIRRLCARAAAPSPARQPGAGPQAPRHDAAPHRPDPQPDQRVPIPHAQPGPVHPGSDPPEDPAETIAMLLRHPTRFHGRWHRPPES